MTQNTICWEWWSQLDTPEDENSQIPSFASFKDLDEALTKIKDYNEKSWAEVNADNNLLQKGLKLGLGEQKVKKRGELSITRL